MAVYRVEVSTEDRLFAGTSDYVYLTLVGVEGPSERTLLNNWGADLTRGTTGSYAVRTPAGTVSLGDLLLVRLEKDPFRLLPEDQWFCSTIVVTTPEDQAVLFPCHRWVSRGQQLELRGGPARKVFEDVNPILLEHRTKELEQRRQVYQYATFAEGMPKYSGFKDVFEVPNDISISISKMMELMTTKVLSDVEIKLKGLRNSTKSWKDLEELKSIYWFRTSPVYEYCVEHWKDDAFYGSQFLNGVNPNIIQRCSQLPPNFPVSEDMVKPFLQPDSSLQTEMKNGNIFLCDYKVLEGIPTTRIWNGEALTVAAGLCLLYENPQGELRPIAIQLQQHPSEENPIFLPSDSETDWLLAKMYIKNADIVHFHNVNHLLNLHFLVEGFALATLRNLPLIHPLYKLLIPHFRFTLQVNVWARQDLHNKDGFLNRSTIGIAGSLELFARGQAATTYESLCLPENIAARGLQSVPNFYYREDGLKLWNIIHSFVKGMVDSYYPSNEDVTRDSELQAWIAEIFTNTFLENASSGIPREFHNVDELTKFVTMVMFRTSGHHAAVHHGQFDYIGWTPNNPMMVRKPPPTAKGQSSMETILETLPDKGTTVKILSSIVVISHKVKDVVPLGQYPSEYFGEAASKQMIKAFQGDLSYLSEDITRRNSELALPYLYLNPAQIENSVAQ